MTEKIKNTLEFALLTVGQPLSMNTFKRLLGNKTDTADIRAALKELADDWATRSMQLVETASGYQFISRPEYTDMLKALLPNKAPRLSKPLMEVLTIIAYRQPVTRGDIEKVRGIAVSSSQLAFLEECGWIEEVGRRDTPGRPILYSTTKIFFDDLGISSLTEMPTMPEISEEEAESAAPQGNGANTSDTTNTNDTEKQTSNLIRMGLVARRNFLEQGANRMAYRQESKPASVPTGG